MRSIFASAIARAGSLLFVLGMLSPGACISAQELPFVLVRSASGKVESRPSTPEAWSPVTIGLGLPKGGAIRTGEAARAGVRFHNGTLLRISETSLVEFRDPADRNASELEIALGKAFFFSRTEKEFPTISTPLVSAAIRGTEIAVEVTPQQTVITVLEGQVQAQNQFGEVLISSGERAVTLRGQAPVKEIVIRPDDAVAWALHYPSVTEAAPWDALVSGASADVQRAFALLRLGDFSAAAPLLQGSDWRDALGRSIVAYQSGDLDRARAELAPLLGASQGVPEAIILQASSLELAAGQVQRAALLLDRLAGQNPRSAVPAMALGTLQSEAAAQRLVIAIALRLRSEAERISRELCQRENLSPSALLACSFEAQSIYELERALDFAERAHAASPRHPAVVARLAELLLSFRRVREAEALLQSAPHVLDPRISTVRGYSALVANDVERARAHFEDAIGTSSSEPRAFLGRGLCAIRRGDLAGGRSDIETAVIMDPTNSLLRSYLGKSFFEEDRVERADSEFERAIMLDGKDPTPHLYRAYNYLKGYEPVQALRSIERSIDLNDNRAVYRSRLLLDQDLAVRGVGLSQIYSDLGFQEAARQEAIRSLADDYTNYSAHLLLASSYAESGDQRLTASLSEFFLSQLLAPRNFNFFQGDASQQASFNEYAALFDRNRIRAVSEGAYTTGIDEATGEIANSGVFDSWSYILDYSTTSFSGYRTNDFDRYQSVLARAQWQPIYGLSLSSGSFFLTSESGDEEVSFDPSGTDPDLREDLDTYYEQVGVRYEISPQLLLIGQAVAAGSNQVQRDLEVRRGFLYSLLLGGTPLATAPLSVLTDRRRQDESESYRADIQLIGTYGKFSFIAGGGGAQADTRREDDGALNPQESNFDLELFGLDSELDVSQYFGRGYVYSRIEPIEQLDIEAGVSYVDQRFSDRFFPPFDGGQRHAGEFLPKFGLSLEPLPDMLLRAAYFENLASVVVGELAEIEPTLVGGFNQNIFDVPGVKSENFGLGVSYKLPTSTYLSSEFLHRSLTREFSLGLQAVTQELLTGELALIGAADTFTFRGDEEGIRTVVNQVLFSDMSATFQHFYSRFEDEILLSDGVSKGNRDTHEFQLGVRHFMKSGISLMADAAYRTQELSGYGENSGDASDGTESFWTFGLGASYKFLAGSGQIGVRIENVFDQHFTFAPTTLSPTIYPERTVAVRYSIAF